MAELHDLAGRILPVVEVAGCGNNILVIVRVNNVNSHDACCIVKVWTRIGKVIDPSVGGIGVLYEKSRAARCGGRWMCTTDKHYRFIDRVPLSSFSKL